ncbi:MAG: hypothetical protein JSR44_07440 [Spirochaetes bacterium]|nr:hypothetical protein [Spirochaetota bacterium]
MALKKDENLGRLLLLAGLAAFAVGVFSENWDVSRLSSLKASRAQLEYDRDEDFIIKKPDYPINEVDYLNAPEVAGDKATDVEKQAYEGAKREYESQKEVLKKKYEDDIQKYNAALKSYNKQSAELRKKKNLTQADYDKKVASLKKSIQQKEIDINKTWIPLFLRFLGSLIFLAGSFFVLKFGTNYEKGGILVLIGFAIKTIVGL